MPDITVHHLERSRSHRILWFLEEAGAAYTLQTYKRNAKTMRADPALKKVHPRGRAPIVVIDGVVLAESGAILEELGERLGVMSPERGTEAHRRCRYFLHYAEGSLMPPLLLSLVVGQLRAKKIPLPVRWLTGTIANQIDSNFTTAELEGHTAFLEEELNGRDYLAGDELTIADVQMSYAVEALLTRAKTSAPRLTAYLERLKARPAWAAAVEKGGPVML